MRLELSYFFCEFEVSCDYFRVDFVEGVYNLILRKDGSYTGGEEKGCDYVYHELYEGVYSSCRISPWKIGVTEKERGNGDSNAFQRSHYYTFWHFFSPCIININQHSSRTRQPNNHPPKRKRKRIREPNRRLTITLLHHQPQFSPIHR